MSVQRRRFVASFDLLDTKALPSTIGPPAVDPHSPLAPSGEVVPPETAPPAPGPFDPGNPMAPRLDGGPPKATAEVPDWDGGAESGPASW